MLNQSRRPFSRQIRSVRVIAPNLVLQNYFKLKSCQKCLDNCPHWMTPFHNIFSLMLKNKGTDGSTAMLLNLTQPLELSWLNISLHIYIYIYTYVIFRRRKSNFLDNPSHQLVILHIPKETRNKLLFWSRTTTGSIVLLANLGLCQSCSTNTCPAVCSTCGGKDQS